MKRYRMRYTPRATMNKVKIRESSLKNYRIARNRRMAYPLFESWNVTYNYQNLKESMINWDKYSTDETSNLTKAGTLLEYIDENHERQLEINESVRIFGNILEEITNIAPLYKYLKRLNINEDSKQLIIEKYMEITNSDRVLRNYRNLDRRYDTTKSIVETYSNWGATEMVYRLCEMTDTYNFGSQEARFIVMAENTLYSIGETLGDNITSEAVMRDIVDYTLLHRGDTSAADTISMIKEALDTSYFFREDYLLDYLDYLERINEGKLPETIEDDRITIIKEYDQYDHIEKSGNALLEASLLDQARDVMTRIKLAPANAAGLAKSAIHSLLVTTRLEDIASGTHNALSIAFYACVTVGGFALGVIPGVLAAITSYLTSKHLNKQYLRSAISEWRDHKRSVERRMDTTKDESQKRRLQTYVDELDKNIDILETQWENVRDKTIDEIKDKEGTPSTVNPSIWKTDVDPNGNFTPSSILGRRNDD